VTENVAKEVHNVFKKASDKRAETLDSARDSHRAVKEGDEAGNEDFALAGTPSSATVSTQAPVMAAQTVTAVSAPASANAMNTSSTMGLDPEVSEALRNVRIEDPGDTVLRLNETDAGKLEVRIRASGDDLVVLVKAEEQALRQKMIDGLPELRKALDRAELVAGRVDVAEFGAFENETRGDGDDQSFFENAFEDSLDQQASDEGEPKQGASGESNPENTSSNGAPGTGSQRTEDGRLHVIV
jgi:flagellar hook-length control protein FliK